LGTCFATGLELQRQSRIQARRQEPLFRLFDRQDAWARVLHVQVAPRRYRLGLLGRSMARTTAVARV